MDPQTWAQLAQSLGVSVACLVALAWAIWKGIKYVGIYIAKPVADRHIVFLDDVTKMMREMVIDHKHQGEVLTRIVDRMEHVAQRVEDVMTNLHEIKGKVVLRANSVTIQPKASDAADTGG